MSICILKENCRERTMPDHHKLCINYRMSGICGKIFKSDERTSDYTIKSNNGKDDIVYLLVWMVRR